MTVLYDKYYQTENLFGKPYPQLIDFFSGYPKKGKVLDLGCGQGRDAIAIARMGFEVTGIDISEIGISQMNRVVANEHLSLTGVVADIFDFKKFGEYEFILLDSMFHFTKNDLQKETRLIKRIVTNAKKGCIAIFCIQDEEKKVKILNATIKSVRDLQSIADERFKYIFEDGITGHMSKTDYRMLVFKL